MKRGKHKTTLRMRRDNFAAACYAAHKMATDGLKPKKAGKTVKSPYTSSNRGNYIRRAFAALMPGLMPAKRH